MMRNHLGEADRCPASIAAGGVLLWVLFFCFCVTLGYPTLNRYDMRKSAPDVISYYKMVTQAEPLTSEDVPFCYRILVPTVARPFYYLAKGRFHTWEPVYFGLLVSTSTFTASATFLLFLIGLRVLRQPTLALLCCALFLLNYVVADLWLDGLVDSSEGFMMLALTWCLFNKKHWLLLLLGVFGVLAKQSVLPFSVVFAGVWWLAEERSKRSFRTLAAIGGMAALGSISLMVDYWWVGGTAQTPWGAAKWWNRYSLWHNFNALATDYRFWYAFVWIVPLGVCHLRKLPRQWVLAATATVGLALALAIYTDLGGTVNRPIFNIIGPLLTLSTTTYLAAKLNRQAQT